MKIKETVESDKPRPRELAGWTWVIEFEKQKLFVTINHDNHRLRELFATEMLDAQFTAGISRMLNDERCEVSEIINQLEELTGTHVAQLGDVKLIHSPEHAVAECLRLAEKYLKKITTKSACIV